MALPISATSPAATSAPAPPEKEFSLAPAIFTRFPSLPKEPPPTDPTARITLALQNLDKQHDAVRRNMLFLIEQRAKDLIATANAELEKLEQEGGEVGETQLLGNEEFEGMMRRVMAKWRSRSRESEGERKKEEYEVKKGDFDWRPPLAGGGEQNLSLGGGGDVQMSGVHTPPRRTATQIRAELSRELRTLIDRGVLEMDAYDVHANETMRVPREALARRKGKRTSIVGGGVLTNRQDNE